MSFIWIVWTTLYVYFCSYHEDDHKKSWGIKGSKSIKLVTFFTCFTLFFKHESSMWSFWVCSIFSEHIKFFWRWSKARTTDTQWRHKSKISEKLGQCGRWNMLWLYLNIWDLDWIFGRAVKAIPSLGVRSLWSKVIFYLRNYWPYLKNIEFNFFWTQSKNFLSYSRWIGLVCTANF